MKSISKKRSSSIFCMCFDSAVLDNGLLVGVEQEKHSWSSSEVKQAVPPAVNMMSSEYNYEDKNKDAVVGSTFGRKNKLGRRNFSRYVKAVLFETSLMKKMRNHQKSGQKLKAKPKNKFSSSESENNVSLMHNISSCEDCTTSATNSSSTTATASRCSSSSLSGNDDSRPSSSEIITMEGKVGNNNNNNNNNIGNNNGKEGCCYIGFNVGIWLLLISLLVLIIWGKVCAIFCTSTWILFAYRWSTKLVPSENITALDNQLHNHSHSLEDVDSELYKKKVIMEGFLERNHSRNRPLALLKQC